jgi:hypothetical protein
MNKMPPAKKVAITVYVPAGKYCIGATYQCPMLMMMGNHPGYYCCIIPESVWWDWQEIVKHYKCPSLFHKSNNMNEEELQKDRMRTFKKAIKNGWGKTDYYYEKVTIP